MALYGQVIALDYTPSLTEWADRFCRFAGLCVSGQRLERDGCRNGDCGRTPYDEPSVADYSGNLDEWMTAH